MNFLEFIMKVGPIFGYISAATTLYIVIKTNILSRNDKHIKEVVGTEKSEKVHAELNKRVSALEEQFAEFIRRDSEFKDNMENHIKTQNSVDKKLMANIIESTYYANKEKRELDMFEFRRITEVYPIYSGDELHGNSYISEMYNEMMTWNRSCGQ